MWENCLHVWLNNTFFGFQQMIDFPFGDSHRLGMTQIPVRATGSRNSTVLEEVGGCSGVGFSGRERPHGGEDQGQAVCDVLVWRAGQSWRESWRQSSGKDQYMTRSFWYSWETHTHLSRLEPWRLHLGSVTPAPQWLGLFLQQCEGACKTKTDLTTNANAKNYRKQRIQGTWYQKD